MASPAEQQSQLAALTNQFKDLTAALVPLAKLDVLLGEYHGVLADWHDSVDREFDQTWRALGVRLGVLVFVLTAVFAASELWRRAVTRYVRDTRRRYQLLLLRRFVMWFVMAIVLASMLASRLDSFVTFAGLITAGIAVALQNVILSVVGYFFLIGKYGVRVGDRIQVGEVLGEVIDVGLVRMHLMEYSRGDLTPTGRVVAFSNSIVFQASGGLFKQLPGVYFTWHEMTLTLPGGTDPTLARERLRSAAQNALASHKEEIDRQGREIERAKFAPSTQTLQPSVRLRYVPAGLEATVRYPVDQRYAGDIDEAVSRELLQAVAREPGLKAQNAPALMLNPAPSA